MPVQFLRVSLFLPLLFFYISLPVIAYDSQECLKKALTAYEEKDFKIARAYFEKYFPASDLLKDYVLFWWADSLKETGKEKEAIRIYNKVAHDSPIRKKAVEEVIGLYKRKGDWVSSINLVRERAALEKNKKLEPMWQKEAVKAGYFVGGSRFAVSNFKRLIENFPETKEALDALEQYGNFYSFKGDGIFRARVYLKHKEFKMALECTSRHACGRQGRGIAAEAFCGLKDYKQAISILEKLVEEEGGEEFKFRLGEIYLIAETRKGLAVLEELVRDKPGTKTACLSLWRLLNYWKRKGDEEKTKIYCKKLREGYRQFSLTDKAIWIEGWMNMSKKNYIEADSVWQEFDTIPRKSREKLSALYLRRWIKLLSNNRGEAKKIFEKLATLYPDTYYGLEAMNHAGFRAGHASFLCEERIGELGEAKYFDRARALIKLGRDEEVTFELEALKGKRYNDINLRYNLSFIYGRANKFSEAIYEAESLIDFFEETGKWPGFVNLSEKELIEINFPRFYQGEVKKRAREFKLDENLIYAVIREESRFNERDVSGSGAIGLMQILPSTAKWIMEKTGLKDITMEDVFKPEINIFLGAWYLRYLLDKFNGDILLAVASYNGGPGLIGRWVEAGGLKDRDIAIEMMPKEETKYFCQKVLFSYHMYGRVYENDY